MSIVRQINIVGCGPGSPNYLTQEAISVVKESSVIVGYDRLMELFPWYGGGAHYPLDPTFRPV